MSPAFLPVNEQMARICRYGTPHSPEQLEKRLAKALSEGVPLRIKAGFDPTAPDLHLGHTVLFRLMRTFQELGHEVVFLIGDFTGLIGDPTGRDTTRPPLSPEDIAANAKTYTEQIGRILDISRLRIDFNSRWLGKLGSEGMLTLAGKYTVARMLERADFADRFAQGAPISVHEFMYPLMQAYDSVALRTDVELGGTDQLFNLLVGRDIQRAYSRIGEYKGEPQELVTVELLEGLDGVKKMSKSLGNHIAIEDSAEDMIGKVMSLNDTVMWRYLLLATDATPQECDELKRRAEQDGNPRDIKLDIAAHVARSFYSEAEIQSACQAFLARFSRREEPVLANYERTPLPEPMPMPNALHALGLVKTTSEGRRMISQGAVKIDGVAVREVDYVFTAEDTLITVGKRRVARAGVGEAAES